VIKIKKTPPHYVMEFAPKEQPHNQETCDYHIFTYLKTVNLRVPFINKIHFLFQLLLFCFVDITESLIILLLHKETIM